MSLLERVDNIYTIDAKMFGLDRYNAAYIVAGKEIALIDTGLPSQLETVRAAIKAHGFSPGNISYIFVTHPEHSDHSGNVAPLLRENPQASVYINPLAVEYITHPEIERSLKKTQITPEMYAQSGDPEPVPPSRIKYLNDGDVFDLGDGEKLQVIFAPGHQPAGIVILEEKNRGLFINDLVGNYFPDADAQYPLNPYRSDHRQAIPSLQKLMDLPVDYLYMGHYGICENPKEVMVRAIANMQKLLDIGTMYVREGNPERIGAEMYEMILPELEKLRRVRGEELYRYASQHHIPSQMKLFTKFCQDNLK
ncbi:MBL fold metallo-hydrolase [Chloroflexota bacterium]